ncbi:hypothetical protein [Ferruginibacter albus]|uniref:hypothetical protein n=1 Tax=Ferruginibacter albus TaxID=2875540 RepID=UPI001CC7C51C|nr:hypothetical protein [Ferruginibacter albus]UAY50935.1 hypothetical protein K9M53_10075 [Ferruginibacter albus]
MTKLLILSILLISSVCSNGQEKQQKKDTFIYFSIIDTNYSKYALPTYFVKPEKWLQADKERKGEMGDWYGDTYPDGFNLQNALALIDTAKDLSFGAAKSWCIKNYTIAFPYLIARLSDKRKIGLNNTADLIIWDRIASGDLEFYGHGGVITEDVFTVAGRASWILDQLTGEEFAVVHGNLTEQQSEKFKLLWVSYIKKLKNN